MHRACLFLLAILFGSCLCSSQLCAELMVYTDRQEWEEAFRQRYSNHNYFNYFRHDKFDNWPVGPLIPGTHSYPGQGHHGFPALIDITIPSPPGFNMIDNDQTNDPFGDALSPNGSNYYLGDVNFATSQPPMLSFWVPDLANGYTPGFGADWVVDGDLTVHVGRNHHAIDFNTYLPSGSGFLGIIMLPHVGDVEFSGTAVFGMDDLVTGNVPEPTCLVVAALPLFLAFNCRRRQ